MRSVPSRLPALPVQPADVPWPTHAWPRGAASPALEAAALPLWDAPEEVGSTLALLVVQGGRVVYERYAAGLDASSTLPSWSMAKSVTHALCGLLLADGQLDLDVPLRPREWLGKGDVRAGITLRHLLAMRSGLEFVEDYVDSGISDVMEMLWGSGKDDVAGYAAMKPALHAPDTHFNYSSGSTNIVARHLGEIVGGGAAGMAQFMRARLFDAIGITSANPKFDGHGTFKGSSFCFCTAQDFARFGLLYLRDGLWDGRRVLPAGWVDTARTVVSSDPTKAHEHYGLHWWINDGGETFAARGYEGQRIVVAPGKDAVVVRLGRSSMEEGPRMHERVLGVVGVL